ncbi:amidase [Nonomuraea insulae]|uniref:Amidase n=1 Tax=Nonomuraea insulae TaxID=1616787 RepID=A0ABW1D8N1_9ACTN
MRGPGLTLRAAAGALARGELRAEELMASVLGRARETEPVHHAYVHLDEENAMAAARAADRAARRGPLHGIPIGVKDLIATAGQPTEAGSPAFAGHRPAADAWVVGRLRAAGAIVVGKHHTHEFGFGLDEPPTRNAVDPDRYPGGSTAGGGVSVALGSSLAAIGTDGGGSIRKPAALNGVAGFKPTHGLVSTAGVLPGVTDLDHIGWITPTAGDAALLLEVLTGRTATPPRGLRLGCPAGFLDGLDPEVEQCFRAAVDVVEIDIPRMAAAAEIHGVIAAAQSVTVHAATPLDLVHPGVRAFLESARSSRTETGLAAALRDRDRLRGAVERAFCDHEVDFLCSPTVALPAVPMAEMDPERMLSAYCRLTLPYNLTGHPALSVPCGTTAAGLPVGLQLAGRLGQDAAVLRGGEMLENTLAGRD